ncbi:Urease accessory protein UreE [Raoultella terrigena]|uniref:Urease accessory protein UreE n=1 Tax=Raoultella terrigena TaxID=577 RepID=A0A3P8LYC3_RAOTE|nr:Urease accessory protein UreE [Raoultella terrigena]
MSRSLPADEGVSVVRCEDPFTLAVACYHLGNRHVPLQIMPGELRYHHDHVLDDMLRQFGLQVSFAQLPFEPEAGAYASESHGHAHGHHHDSGHDHHHEHGH